MILIVLFVFITLLVVLYHMTRGDNNENRNDDPQFNPFNNPFIHVGGRFLKKDVKNPNVADNQPN